MKVAAVILAAGASSRLGEPKQLLRDEHDETLVHRIARDAIASGCDPVLVVVGSSGEQVAQAVSELRVSCVENVDWAAGLSTSIRAGVRAAMLNDVDAVLLLTCDMPSVGVAHLEALLEALQTEADRVASSYGETVGIPAAVRRSEFEILCSLTGDRGAKSLLQRPGTASVPLVDGTFDLDTPANVLAWRRRGN